MTHNPHYAESEKLTGSVNWSNQADDMFSFQVDGEDRKPGDDQVFYRLVSTSADYPPCLASQGQGPVREDLRRIEMQAIHVKPGEKQDINIALAVTCLS